MNKDFRQTISYTIFRPPFINGRPQDSVSVFGEKKALVPFFEVKAPLFSFKTFSAKSSAGRAAVLPG